MDAAIPDKQDLVRQDSLRLIAYSLLAGFFLPVVFSLFGTTKILFINIAMLGKGSIYQTLMLLHPLLAGLAALWLGKRLQGLAHAVSLLALGMLPIVLIVGDDLLSQSLRGLKFQTMPLILLALSLIGLYVGCRHYAKTGYPLGKFIAAISAGLFMLISLVPVTGAKPPFFSFFDLFKMGRISSGFVLLGLTLIGVFVCYMFAALTAFINLQDPPHGQETSARAARIVLLGSVAIPLALLLLSISSGGFFMVLFAYLKFTLWIAGVLTLIAWAWLDLLEQLQPATLTGAQLFQATKQSPAAARRPPPNIWDGPPPEA